MIRVSFLYPNESGKNFDHNYFTSRHMPLVRDRMTSLGLVRFEVDRGIGGGTPDNKAPFISACHLYFKSVDEFRKAVATHGAELMGDVPNYTNIEPQMQISEIVL